MRQGQVEPSGIEVALQAEAPVGIEEAAPPQVADTRPAEESAAAVVEAEMVVLAGPVVAANTRFDHSVA